ncbi:MAG: PTS transporter subunit EIIC [Clostridia bacterium]|nr:PTS transporter subunit EIIC [Clostridia bacterium]
MLPIAILPIAGLLLGVGSSFTNPATLESLGLSSVIYEGSILHTLLSLMANVGSAVFDNLALLFAVGVAIGMAKKEKEVAALAAVVSFLIMNTAISALIFARGGVDALPPNTTTVSLGITTLQTGVFGGIIVGLGVAYLHNRFYKIRLPQVISFFGGTRFVPIISALAYTLVGVLIFFVWPPIQRGISSLGQLVLESGYAGTWIYGIIERALIPFGLHHVFYVPFWQTELGGTAIIGSQVVQGAQNIFFAELAAGVDKFSVSATRFMSGKFPFMIFGLPAAAYAMYRAAKPEKRRAVGGLLLSAALTSALTGITEPIEFTFLFVAPLMYGIHCVLAGLSYMLMHILEVGVGMTFSGGLIDLTLFGVLQGNDRTNWVRIILVGIVYAVVYFLLFYLLIRKLGLKTPGREEDGEESRLYSRADYESARRGGNKGGKGGRGAHDFAVSALILSGLGGLDNLRELDCCATRLRVTVNDSSHISEASLRQSGASGVITSGNGVQVIYGPSVSVIKSALEDYIDAGAPPLGEAEDSENENVSPETDGKSQVMSGGATETLLLSPLGGTLVPLDKVGDEAFAIGALGEGIAIEPETDTLMSPCDGTVGVLFDTRHAVTVRTDTGLEILMHIGIDTVRLKGEGFSALVKPGQRVRAGDALIKFDLEKLKRSGYSATTPLTVTSEKGEIEVKTVRGGAVTVGQEILKVKTVN